MDDLDAKMKAVVNMSIKQAEKELEVINKYVESYVDKCLNVGKDYNDRNLCAFIYNNYRVKWNRNTGLTFKYFRELVWMCGDRRLNPQDYVFRRLDDPDYGKDEPRRLDSATYTQYPEYLMRIKSKHDT